MAHRANPSQQGVTPQITIQQASPAPEESVASERPSQPEELVEAQKKVGSFYKKPQETAKGEFPETTNPGTLPFPYDSKSLLQQNQSPT